MHSGEHLSDYSREILVEYERVYSGENNETQTILCISFVNSIVAGEFYKSAGLDDTFALLEENRIIIKPASRENPYGMHEIENSRNVYVNLPGVNFAEIFYQKILLGSVNNDKLVRVTPVSLKYHTRIEFHGLIHPYYSLEKRIKAEELIIKQFAFYFFVLKNLKLQDEIADYPGLNPFTSKEFFRDISLITFNRLISLMDPLRFTGNYLVRALLLNAQFGLPSISTDLKMEICEARKINIREIKYSTISDSGSKKIHHLHFIAETEQDADLLALKLQAADQGYFYDYKGNNSKEVSVSGISTIFNEKTRTKLFAMRFDYANQLDHFMESVDFTIPGITRNEKDWIIYFPESSLSKKKKFEINVWGGCENELGRSNIGLGGKQQLNVFVDTIHIEKIKSLPENIEMKNTIVISSDKYATANDLYLKKGINPLVMIKANDKKIFEVSNAAHAIPEKYLAQKGMMGGFRGLYLVNNVKLQGKNCQDNSAADFVFISIPDLNGANKDHFSRKSYLKCVTSLMIMQFYLARFSGNVLIMGRWEFGNDDEDISAIIRQVNQMPEFKNIQVICALGEDNSAKRSLHTIYSKPLQEKMREANVAINDIRKECGLNMHELSKNLLADYQRGKNLAPLVKEIHQFIDEKIIKNLNEGSQTKWDAYSISFNGLYSLFYSEEDMKERIKMQDTRIEIINVKINTMERLKQDIKTGLYAGIALTEILSGFRTQYEYILSLNRVGDDARDTVSTLKLLGELEKQFCGKEEIKPEPKSSFRYR